MNIRKEYLVSYNDMQIICIKLLEDIVFLLRIIIITY